MARLQAVFDPGQGLRVAAQRAGEHGIEAQAMGAEPRAQALALLPAERAQLVVVGRAERGLAVAHEVEASHDRRHCAGIRRAVARTQGLDCA